MRSRNDKSKDGLIRQVVKAAGNDRTEAARMLGVSEASISRYIKHGQPPIPPVVLLARRIVRETGVKPCQ